MVNGQKKERKEKGRKKYMRDYCTGNYQENEEINSCKQYSLGREVKIISG